MRASTFLGILLASNYQTALVRAVYPNFPAGDIQTAGKTCHIAWGGDTPPKTEWKDMTIEFMTGDNFNMVHLTTVATDRDGTVAGSFDWICPQVNPNAAIYFYQFRSPHTPDYAWTTRFPIASSSGKVTSPPESKQSDGAAIPWGKGALVDPSKASPPPVFTTKTTAPSATSVKPPMSTSTPNNVAPGVVTGCTGFFTRTTQLCYQMASAYGISIENFEAWNGGARVCDVLESGKSYCVGAPTKRSTSSPPIATPKNVAKGVVSGCTKFFTRTNQLCYTITADNGITVAQFESWNGAGVCDVLVPDEAYCVARS
ncbi:hypothetical protein DXG01_003442 [Tephrocybe rancida]|nr:hypothetical protein DXG01_003442 [Tephrocybe rancida]